MGIPTERKELLIGLIDFERTIDQMSRGKADFSDERTRKIAMAVACYAMGDICLYKSGSFDESYDYE